MNQASTAELQQMVRDTFGRELTEAQVEAYRGRLLNMVRAVHILREWEEKIDTSEPAAVHRTPTFEGEEYGTA